MARLKVRVSPRSSRSGLAYGDGVLTAHLHSPPAEGRANEELIGLLSKRLGVSKSSLSLVRGAKSRNKEVEVSGLDEAALMSRLSELLDA